MLEEAIDCTPARARIAAALLLLGAALPSAAQICSDAASAAGWTAPVVVAGDRLVSLDEMAAALAGRRAIYVGESHDRLDHHLNQLEIICRLHRADPRLAIGLEMFQRPFQKVLDDYVTGRIDLDGLLARSEYFDRWRFDARLYAPIFEFARANGLPMVALNAATEIVQAVSSGGLEGLSDEQRARVPAPFDRSDSAYMARLEAVFERHGQGQRSSIERFISVQLLWDETMADTAARYLQAHPERRMVVVAGNGHVAYGSGIPSRVARRTALPGATVVNESPGDNADPASADYLLLSRELELPRAGLMGVFLETREQGLTVAQVSAEGAAEAAGIREGDRVVAVDGREVDTFADVKSMLWRHAPGDVVRLAVRPSGGAARDRIVELELR